MTLTEIRDVIEAAEAAERASTKRTAESHLVLSQLIAQSVMGCPEGSEPRQLWDFYPDLFKEEKKAAYKQALAERKARIIAYNEQKKREKLKQEGEREK